MMVIDLTTNMTSWEMFKFFLQNLLPYVLSLITVVMTWFAGSKKSWAWVVGLVNQCLWFVWIMATGYYGFLPMNVALWLIYFRNHLLWTKPEVLPPSAR